MPDQGAGTRTREELIAVIMDAAGWKRGKKGAGLIADAILEHEWTKPCCAPGAQWVDAAVAEAVKGAEAQGYSLGYKDGLARGDAEAREQAQGEERAAIAEKLETILDNAYSPGELAIQVSALAGYLSRPGGAPDEGARG